MKIIELEKNKRYLIRIERNEKVMEQLGKFADQYLKTNNGYKFAEFSGLGGGLRGSAGYFSQVSAVTTTYSGPSELLNIIGNITNRKGSNDKFIHIHATFGKTEKDNHQAWGFHLNDSTVGLTIEMTLNIYDVVILRDNDQEGLPLLLSSARIEEEESDSNKTELDKLREENERLKKRNEELEKENTELKNQSSTVLREQIKKLNDALMKANKITQKANTTNQQLIAQIQVNLQG